MQAGLPAILQDGTYTYVYGKGLISQTDSSGNQTYLLSNALGSTEVLTDGSGTVTGTKTYEPFGTVRSSTGSASTEYQYTGQQRDDTLGYTYLRARYYDPAIGRFISKDTYPAKAKDPESINRYAYVQNNPVNLTDPAGQCWCIVAAVALISLEDLIFAGAYAGAMSSAALAGKALGDWFGNLFESEEIDDEDIESEWQPRTRDKRQDKSSSSESRKSHEEEFDDIAEKYRMNPEQKERFKIEVENDKIGEDLTPERMDEIARGIVG